jgi:hypothetical protein
VRVSGPEMTLIFCFLFLFSFFVGEGSRVRVSGPEMILILFFFFLFLFFVGEGAGAQGCVSAGPR